MNSYRQTQMISPERATNPKRISNENKRALHQQLIAFGGFRSNGYQIRNQRTILHRIASLKIDFRFFLEGRFFEVKR